MLVLTHRSPPPGQELLTERQEGETWVRREIIYPGGLLLFQRNTVIAIVHLDVLPGAL